MSILIRLLLLLSACAAVLVGILGGGLLSAQQIMAAEQQAAQRHDEETILLQGQAAAQATYAAVEAYLAGDAAAHEMATHDSAALQSLTATYARLLPADAATAPYSTTVARFTTAAADALSAHDFGRLAAAQRAATTALAGAAGDLSAQQQRLLSARMDAWTAALHDVDQTHTLAFAERIGGAAIALALVGLLTLFDFIRHGQPLIVLARQARRALRLPPEEMPDFVLSRSEPGSARQLARSLNNLVAQLREKYLDLERANASLHELNDAARSASLAKTAFVANISHELRTPLNAILGFSEMLLAEVYGPVTPRQHAQLERILRNGQQLLTLINDVLDISRVEAGKIALAPGPVDVAQFAVALAGAFEPLVRQKGLTWRLEVDPQLPPLVTDENRLRQILLNLLSNAVKFTRKGSVTLWIGQDASLPGWVVFKVRDTGIGIPATELSQIWQEFYQVDQSLDRTSGGSGLGLAITRKLIEVLGGDVEVQSTEGKGSVFTLYLPLTPPQARDGAAGASLYAATGSYVAAARAPERPAAPGAAS